MPPSGWKASTAVEDCPGLSASRADWTVLVARTVWPVTSCNRVASGMNAGRTSGRGSEARLEAVHMPTTCVAASSASGRSGAFAA
jgi:hypothetical protein